FADIESKMFKGIGPFASFSNKIDFGFLLGLYPPYAHRQLHRIKEIRNLFAHNPQPISFRSQKVRDICAHLKAPKGAHRRFSGMFDSILSDHNAPRVRLSLFRSSNNPRTQYIRAAQQLTWYLTLMIALGHSQSSQKADADIAENLA